MQLQDLADAARFAGNNVVAERALRAVRQRFANSPQAALASFHLGRLAFDQQKRYAVAVGHFSHYLREQPQGALVGDAWGRLLEAHTMLPASKQAFADATQYLARFPNGPYAPLARRVLQRQAP